MHDGRRACQFTLIHTPVSHEGAGAEAVRNVPTMGATDLGWLSIDAEIIEPPEFDAIPAAKRLLMSNGRETQSPLGESIHYCQCVGIHLSIVFGPVSSR